MSPKGDFVYPKKRLDGEKSEKSKKVQFKKKSEYGSSLINKINSDLSGSSQDIDSFEDDNSHDLKVKKSGKSTPKDKNESSSFDDGDSGS